MYKLQNPWSLQQTSLQNTIYKEKIVDGDFTQTYDMTQMRNVNTITHVIPEYIYHVDSIGNTVQYKWFDDSKSNFKLVSTQWH